MRALVVLLGAIIYGFSPAVADAQEAASRIEVARAHRLVWAPGGQLSKTRGTLRVDPQWGRIDFVTPAGVAFAIPFDAIQALYAGPAGGDYLTVFYGTAKATLSEAIQLPDDAVEGTVAALEAWTGRTVDRSAGSLLAVPLRAAPGEGVIVTTASGERLEGRLLSLSTDALTVAGRDGVRRVFEPESLSTVRRARTIGHDFLRGLGYGALIGAGMGATFGGLAVAGDLGTGSDVVQLTVVAAVQGAFIGGGLSAAIPSVDFRRHRDIYVAPAHPRAGTEISLAPELGTGRRAMHVMVRF